MPPYQRYLSIWPSTLNRINGLGRLQHSKSFDLSSLQDLPRLSKSREVCHQSSPRFFHCAISSLPSAKPVLSWSSYESCLLRRSHWVEFVEIGLKRRILSFTWQWRPASCSPADDWSEVNLASPGLSLRGISTLIWKSSAVLSVQVTLRAWYTEVWQLPT